MINVNLERGGAQSVELYIDVGELEKAGSRFEMSNLRENTQYKEQVQGVLNPPLSYFVFCCWATFMTNAVNLHQLTVYNRLELINS